MWYSARLLYRSIVEDSIADQNLYEEKIIVFRAAGRGEAYPILTQLAREQEDAFENVEGNRVEWELSEVLEVQELFDDPIKDGTEVYSRHLHNPSPTTLDLLREVHGERWWTSGSEGGTAPASPPSDY